MKNYLLNNYRELKKTYTHKQIRALYSVYVWQYIMNDNAIPSLKDFILSINKLDLIDIAESLECYGWDTYITILYNYYM